MLCMQHQPEVCASGLGDGQSRYLFCKAYIVSSYNWVWGSSCQVGSTGIVWMNCLQSAFVAIWLCVCFV